MVKVPSLTTKVLNYEVIIMKNIFLIILIFVNVGLIITSVHYISSMNELESRLLEIENEVRNPSVKIIPTNQNLRFFLK